MGIVLTATEEELLEPGIYRVKLKGTEPKTGTVKKQMSDGSVQDVASNYIRWSFEIIEEGFEGELRANSSDAFGTQSKARNWVEVLLRRALEKDEQFNFDKLIGQEAMASVKHSVKGDKTYAEIESLAPIRTPKAKAPATGLPPIADDDPVNEF